jgi:hypothetical protein
MNHAFRPNITQDQIEAFFAAFENGGRFDRLFSGLESLGGSTAKPIASPVHGNKDAEDDLSSLVLDTSDVFEIVE